MATVLNRTTKELKTSVNTPDYDPADWIINPNLDNVDGVDPKYWSISGDIVFAMPQHQRDSIDTQEAMAAEATEKATAKAVVDGADAVMNRVLTAMAAVIQEELQAIKNGTPLASRDTTALKQAVKDKIDG